MRARGAGRGGRAPGGLGDGRHRWRRRSSVDAGRGAAGAHRRLRQQGGAGLRRQPVHAGGRRHGATLLPVDSEHNAIWQCFDFERVEHIEKITLTCSGGPFRELSVDEMRDMTVEASGQAPHMEHGREDFDRLGNVDEQGLGDYRGASPVPAAVGADRRRDPPAIGYPRARDLSRRLGAGASGHAGHAHADRLRSRLARTYRGADAAARPRLRSAG